MVFEGKWIQASTSTGDVCPVFRKDWFATDSVRKAELIITALGVYEAVLNGSRVSEDVLMPGWTVYEKRLQYQTYDITELLETENSLTVTVGKGGFHLPCRDGWNLRIKNAGKTDRGDSRRNPSLYGRWQ